MAVVVVMVMVVVVIDLSHSHTHLFTFSPTRTDRDQTRTFFPWPPLFLHNRQGGLAPLVDLAGSISIGWVGVMHRA